MQSFSTKSTLAEFSRSPEPVLADGALSALNGPPIRVVRGRRAVLAIQGMLHALGRLSGQADATNWLEHFLTSPEALTKTPYVLLVGCDTNSRPRVSAKDLMGAVLLYEYKWKGWGTGIFATDNVAGARTVIAPERVRMQVARAALRKLLTMGAAVALITVDRGLSDWEREAAETQENFRLMTRTREVPLYLPLENTLDATLALLGSRTRRNFRSYRRHAERDLGAEFVAEIQMTRAEFMEMNQRSTLPASEAVLEWHYDLLQRMGRDKTFFSGVRASDGRWLSLIGGRRNGTTTEIDWQMNLRDLPRYSLSTVMRAFLLEHEVARGTRRLWFEGGTAHSMHHSFMHGEVTDLLGLREGSLRALAMQKFARWRFPVRNFLSTAMREMEQETAERNDPPQEVPSRAA